MKHHNPSNSESCIRLCNECSAACLQTSRHGLDMGGEHASPEHQALLHDCADICATAARFMARHSAHHPHLCRECAEICNACAGECEQMRGADEQTRQCAEICRRCAQSCQQMAGASV